jgi:hypothetical protein
MKKVSHDQKWYVKKQIKICLYREWYIQQECKSYLSKLFTLEDKHAKWHLSIINGCCMKAAFPQFNPQRSHSAIIGQLPESMY